MVIGVLFGGRSVEHDISILSAMQVIKALDTSKYTIIPLYLSKDLNILSSSKYSSLETYQRGIKPDKKEYVNLIKKNNAVYLSRPYQKFARTQKIDLILPIVHGKGVEDGTISGFLEILGITYPTCKVMPASITQDKEITKIILKELGINVIPYTLHIDSNDIKYPVIVKPAKLGSSIGIYKANNFEELKEAFGKASRYDSKVLIEKCLVNFKEFSNAGYYYKEEVIVSDIEEVKLVSDIYSFSEKYQNQEKILNNNHQIPAHITKDLTLEIKETTKKIYKRLELSGVVRVDYLYDLDTNTLYVNEINTIPGSLAYFLFKDKTLGSLLDDLIKQSLIDKEKEKEYLNTFSSSVLNNNKLAKK